MRSAVIKLESFTRTGPYPDAAFDQQALDKAYADGLSEGLSRHEDEQMRNLGAGIARLTTALAEDGARRASLRSEAVTALLPLLGELLDALTPAPVSQRLERSLTEELTRLSRCSQPLRARIICNERLRAIVERSLAESGASGIEIDTAETDHISLSLQGGRIEFSQDDMARQIRALIAEIREDEPSWTH